MTKFSLKMILDIGFDLIPITFPLSSGLSLIMVYINLSPPEDVIC